MNSACYLPLRSGDSTLIGFLFVDQRLLEGNHYAAFVFELIKEMLHTQKLDCTWEELEWCTQAQAESIQAFDSDIFIIGLEDVRVFKFSPNAVAGRGHIFTFYMPTEGEACPVNPYYPES